MRCSVAHSKQASLQRAAVAGAYESVRHSRCRCRSFSPRSDTALLCTSLSPHGCCHDLTMISPHGLTMISPHGCCPARCAVDPTMTTDPQAPGLGGRPSMRAPLRANMVAGREAPATPSFNRRRTSFHRHPATPSFNRRRRSETC